MRCASGYRVFWPSRPRPGEKVPPPAGALAFHSEGLFCHFLTTRQAHWTISRSLSHIPTRRGREMSKMTTPLPRRTLLQSALALGASQVVGAPFIVTARGDAPVK